MHDRQEVFGKLDLGRLVVVVENHEFDPVPLEEPAEELESEATEAVAVGHGNRAYTSVKRASQKGSKAFALEVEATANVFDDFGAWAALAEEGDLSFEVRLLASGGDATVGNVNSGGNSHRGTFLSRLGVHGRLGCRLGLHCCGRP